MGKGVNPWVFGISLLLSSLALAISSFYVEEVRSLGPVFQGLIITGISLAQMFVTNILDSAAKSIRSRSISKKLEELEARSTQKDRDLANLRDVIISFIENSSIYKDRVKRYLELDDDFFCIAKSAEGLSEVFASIGGGVQLPFTKTLHTLPGSVKPLETMDFFIIPARNLPKLQRLPLNEFILQEIIPKVRRERARFLRELPRKSARLAEDFSYKYVAFLANRNAIAYGTKNRKFNQAFTNMAVAENVINDFRKLKDELVKTIRTKELFRLVDWRAFADLNNDQAELVEYYKKQINQVLEENNIVSLRDIATTSPLELRDLMHPIVYRKFTKLRTLNLCKKVIGGAKHTLDVLTSNGVNL